MFESYMNYISEHYTEMNSPDHAVSFDISIMIIDL